MEIRSSSQRGTREEVFEVMESPGTLRRRRIRPNVMGKKSLLASSGHIVAKALVIGMSARLSQCTRQQRDG